MTSHSPGFVRSMLVYNLHGEFIPLCKEAAILLLPMIQQAGYSENTSNVIQIGLKTSKRKEVNYIK